MRAANAVNLVCCFLGINLVPAVHVTHDEPTSEKVQHCKPRDAAANKTRTSAFALEMFTLCMNKTSKGKSPRERPRPCRRPRPRNFF
jgi:hypothetical protein